MVCRIQTGYRKGSLILSNNRAVVLHQGGQCKVGGGGRMDGWFVHNSLEGNTHLVKAKCQPKTYAFHMRSEENIRVSYSDSACFCEYIQLEAVRIHVICRVHQAGLTHREVILPERSSRLFGFIIHSSYHTTRTTQADFGPGRTKVSNFPPRWEQLANLFYFFTFLIPYNFH